MQHFESLIILSCLSEVTGWSLTSISIAFCRLTSQGYLQSEYFSDRTSAGCHATKLLQAVVLAMSVLISWLAVFLAMALSSAHSLLIMVCLLGEKMAHLLSKHSCSSLWHLFSSLSAVSPSYLLPLVLIFINLLLFLSPFTLCLSWTLCSSCSSSVLL